MRAVVQRVTRAAVTVDGAVVGAIDRPGLVALIGVTHDDTPARAETIARKIAGLRILRDERSLVDVVAEALRAAGLEVATGSFGADMSIELVADGPVTILLEA
jgi:D-aminoacyl-tRNA deacylase